MKTLLFYLLQVIVTSGILYGYYHFALRNKRFHKYNRFYLLAATVVSMAVPFLNIPVYFTQSDAESSFVLQTLTIISGAGADNSTVFTTSAETHSNWFTWQNLSWLIYMFIAFIVLLRIIFSLLKIRRIVRSNPVEQLDTIRFVNTTEPGTPFSFFRWLFWNKKIELHSEKGEQIFRHELFHIEQKHSRDTIYMELLTVVFWINPFFYLIKKELKAIHESLADQFAVSENTKWQYAELLLMQVLNTTQKLVNAFFNNQIKRRIAMLTTSKKPSHQYLRKLMVLPFAAIVFALFAFNYKERSKGQQKIQDLKQFDNANLPDTMKPGNDVVQLNYNVSLGQPPQKRIATAELLKAWQDSKKYGVWIDNKRVTNSEINNYSSSDFSHYFVSKLEKNAINYGKHYYQVDLMTNKYYDKTINDWDPSEQLTARRVVLRDTLPTLLKKYERYLIAIDDKVQDENLTIDQIEQKIDTKDIKSINVLKEKNATEKYGQKGKNGVIEIITKKTAGIVKKEEDVDISAQNSGSEGLGIGDNIAAFYDYLLVVDGKVKGRMKENMQNPDLRNAVHVTVLDWVTAKKKYGEEGKWGAWEAYTMKSRPEDYLNDMNTSRPGVGTLDVIFDKPAIPPSFPGGTSAWQKYLSNNLNSSIAIDSGAAPGAYKVWIQFIVDENGNISDLRPITSYGHSMENEVMRIIAKVPKWIPALQNGRKVRAYMQQPVTFVISEEPDVTILNPVTNASINTLYIGVDNRLTIFASDVNPENLIVTISNGTIEGGKGKYIARVHSVGETSIEIYALENGKKKKLAKKVVNTRVIPIQKEKFIEVMNELGIKNYTRN